MSTPDKQITVAVALVVLIHAIVLMMEWVVSSFGIIVYLNLVVSISLLSYWVQKQIRIQQHIIEPREVAVLGFETAVAGCSVYALIGGLGRWIEITHVVVSGVHFLAALAFLIFMLTFKMKKLF